MSFALTKNEPKFYVNLAIMILIMVGFRFITPPAGMTADGLAVVGVFFGVLYGWLFIDMIWPSFMGLVVLGMTLPQPMDAVLGGAFGNNTYLLLLFFCMVASIINAAGIAEYVARRIICVPVVVGRPWVLVFMLCIAMCALATMLTMTAAVLVAFPLIKEVCRQYGYKPGDSFPMILLLAMLYVADIAYMMLPFKSLPAIVFGIYGQMSGGQEINLAAYVGVTGLLLLISIFFVIFICKYVLKADVTPILENRECMHFDEQLSPYQKTILWSFLGLIVLLLLPNILPGVAALSKFLKAMGNNGILLAYIGIYLMLNFKEGIGLKEIMHKSVAWPALFLVAAVLRITGAFEATGVTKFIADTCEPMLPDSAATCWCSSSCAPPPCAPSSPTTTPAPPPSLPSPTPWPWPTATSILRPCSPASFSPAPSASPLPPRPPRPPFSTATRNGSIREPSSSTQASSGYSISCFSPSSVIR